MQAAIAAGYRRLHIEGDNLVVIEALKGISATPWQLKHIIQDVQEMLNQFELATINHIFRDQIWLLIGYINMAILYQVVD